MSVPRLLVLTDRRQSQANGRTLLETVTHALLAGAPAVVLREKDLPRAARRTLAVDLLEAAERHGAQLLIASDAGLARELGATGVHLAADDPPVDDGHLLVGRSCHTRTEVRTAVEQRHDYLTVSPVALTDSKPGYGPALGPEGLAQLVDVADDLPILALGGVTPADVSTWIRVGAHGVAVMGAVMGAADPEVSVRSFLDALQMETP
jgi:thiamine-phosphate diphosphorylase